MKLTLIIVLVLLFSWVGTYAYKRHSAWPVRANKGTPVECYRMSYLHDDMFDCILHTLHEPLGDIENFFADTPVYVFLETEN